MIIHSDLTLYSLLATLAELRILLLTVFLSGAVHLAIFGGGWLDDIQPVAVAGQNISITVTAPRPQSIAVSPEAERAVPVTTPAAIKEQLPAPAVATQSTTALAAKPTLKKQPLSAASSSESEAIEANRTELKRPAPEKVAAIKAEPEKPKQPEIADVTVSATPLQEPVYQQQPAFLKPPQPPTYPRMARKRGTEGQVMLRVELNEAGDITALSVEHSSGSGLLDRAAQDAVEKWQFAPAQRNGISVASYVRIPVNFILE